MKTSTAPRPCLPRSTVVPAEIDDNSTRRARWSLPILSLLVLAGLALCPFTSAAPLSPEVAGRQDEFTNESTIGRGSNDLTNQLLLDTEANKPLIHTPGLDAALAPWYAWKAEIYELYGLQFSLAYSALGQVATDARPGQQDATGGGVFDIGGVWELLKRESDWQGMLGFRIGDQHRLGTSVAPAGFGDEIGSAWGTSLGFDSVPFDALELWWEQRLTSRFTARFGKLDASSIFDPSSLGNPFEQFMGHPFNVNSTIAFPGEGLGIIGQAQLYADVWLLGGIVDGNGNGKDWNFDSFFNDNENLLIGEIAWTPEFAFGKGEYHITAWRSDERVAAEAPGGDGFTVYGEQRFGNVMPFARYGHSSGGAAGLKNMITVGSGFYHPFGRVSDGVGVGASWGEPFGGESRDQYGVEAYYRIQLTNEVAITPDIQYIINPAQNQEVDSLLVFSLRMRVNF